MKVKTIIEMDYSELEGIVNRFYKREEPYEFVADQECGNDSSHTFRIEKAQPLHQGRINRFMRGENPTHMAQDIFQDLVNKGQLVPGEYLIKVSW